MSKQDYYELLQVTKQADASEIKAAYRKKAFEFHPDRNPGNHEAEEKFKLVAEAYDVLSDSNKRSIYDQYGHAGLQGGGFGGFGGQGFSNAEDIFSTFGDIFEDFFGFQGGSGRGRTQSRARRGRDLQAEVQIEFLEACFGVQKEIKVSQNVACETCEGSGAKKGSGAEVCAYCKGHGQVQMSQGFFTISTTCPQCGGQGQTIKHKCADCRGTGLVHKDRKLKVKVPAGITNGTRLLMQREGEPGQHGGPAGDLYVFVHVAEHTEFERQDDHILSELKVNFAELALGCEKRIPTIEGEDTLKIKPGTQSGEILKLKGKGVANVRSGRRGDHLIHIQAVTPAELTQKQKELLEQLSKEFAVEEPAEQSTKKKKGVFR